MNHWKMNKIFFHFAKEVLEMNTETYTFLCAVPEIIKNISFEPGK